MVDSEITLRDAIEMLGEFCPCKIIFNGLVLYDDYSFIEGENCSGEEAPPLEVIPNRVWQFDKYIVTSINIKIVDFHHSIVSISGEYAKSDKQ